LPRRRRNPGAPRKFLTVRRDALNLSARA